MLTIKLEAANLSHAGHITYFDFENGSIEDIKAIVDGMNTDDMNDAKYETSIYGDILLIKMSSENISHFAVKKLSDSVNRFAISDMAAFVDRTSGQTAFLFPYHLCLGLENDTSHDKYDLLYSFTAGEEDPVRNDYSAWKEFYASCNRTEFVFDDTEQTITIDGTIRLSIRDGKIKID